MQVANGPEVLVFGDEVTPERLCPTLSIAEHAVRGALGVLETSAVIRQYIGTQIVKSLDAGIDPEKRNPPKLEDLRPSLS